MIDLDQWGGVKASHTNTLGNIQKNGLHEVIVDNKKNYFYIENANKIDAYDQILFSFNGAVSDREKKKAPFFSMLGVAKRLNIPVVAVSDYSTMIHQKLGLAWYLGNEEFSKQVEFIAENIYNVCKIYKKKPLLVGGSGGGFAALNIGNYLKNHLNMDLNIFVWNPQTDVSRYYKRHVRNYIEKAFSSSYTLSGFDYIEFLKRKVKFSDVLINTDFADLNILYLQNNSDDHFELHAKPFIGNNNLNELSCNIYNVKNIYLLSPNWGEGHLAPNITYIEEIVKKIMHNVDYKCIVDDLKNTSYFKFLYEKSNQEVNQRTMEIEVFKNIFKNDSIKIGRYEVNVVLSFENGSLNVKLNSNNQDVLYCCYLYRDGKVVEKKNYNINGVFCFYAEFFESGHYSLRIYVLNKNKNIRVSKVVDLSYIYNPSKYIESKLNKTINNAYALLGEELYKNGRLVFNKLPSVEFTNDIFSIDPLENRTWRWKLHQLEIVLQLISYHKLKNKSDDILKLIMNYIKMWYSYSLSNTGMHDTMVWHDHGSALRLNNIHFLLIYLLKNNFINCFDEDYFFIINLIKIHIQKLVDESFYSEYTNHGFDQSIFLFQAVSELNNLFSNNLEFKAIAAERISNEANFAFCKDGGHKENSIGYLNFGIKQILIAIDVLNNYGFYIENLKIILDKATIALAYAVKPNGYLPLIGDTSKYKVVDIFSTYKPETYNQFKYAITYGQIGHKPLFNKLVLTDSGYAFFRSHWNKEGFEDAVHLILKASYKSNYHRHDDDLSLVLYGYGEDWLIDGGTYKYNEKDENRRYIRSSSSHNILNPVNAKALRVNSNKHNVELKDLAVCDSNKFHISACTEMFDGYMVYREVENINFDTFIVHDICKKRDYSYFDVVSRFFFDENKIISFESDHVLIIQGKNKKLRMEVKSDYGLNIVVRQTNEQFVEGWLSNDIGVLFKTQRVEIRNMNKIVDCIKMKIIFSFI